MPNSVATLRTMSRPDLLGQAHGRRCSATAPATRSASPRRRSRGCSSPATRCPEPGMLERQRRVEDVVVEPHPEVEGGGIDEGLEARSGLAHGLDRAVELARRRGCCARRPWRARPRRRDITTMAACASDPARTLVSKTQLERVLRRLLDPLVEGGAHDDVLGRVAGQEVRPVRHDPVGEIAARVLPRGRARASRGWRWPARTPRSLEVALLAHQAQHRRGAVLRALQVVGRARSS